MVSGIELRYLKQLRRRNPNSCWVFVSERGGPMTRRNVHAIVSKAGRDAKIGFPVHSHCFRHSLGFHMSEKGVPTRSLAATWTTRISTTPPSMPRYLRPISRTGGRIETGSSDRRDLHTPCRSANVAAPAGTRKGAAAASSRTRPPR